MTARRRCHPVCPSRRPSRAFGLRLEATPRSKLNRSDPVSHTRRDRTRQSVVSKFEHTSQHARMANFIDQHMTITGKMMPAHFIALARRSFSGGGLPEDVRSFQLLELGLLVIHPLLELLGGLDGDESPHPVMA